MFPERRSTCTSPSRDDDELCPCAVHLTPPPVADGIQWYLLHVETNVSGDRVADETAVLLAEHVGRDGVHRHAEDRQVLEPHRLGGKRSRRGGRLAEVDDGRVGGGSQD